MRPFRPSSLLFLLLAAAAFAQPGPPGSFSGGPPPDLASFAAEVHFHPTDAKSVHPRLRLFMESLRFEGRRPEQETLRQMAMIRHLLGVGKLTMAAHLLDQTVIGAQIRAAAPASGAAASMGTLAPQPVMGLSAVGLGVPELAAQAPALLSAPSPSRAVAAANEGSRSALPLASIARPADPAPAPPGPPWRLLAGLAGLAAFAGAGLLLAAIQFTGAAKTVARPSSPAPRAPLEPPAPNTKTLGEKYSIGRSIASGGMGEVYEGRDLTLGRRVAIKRMLSHIKLDDNMRSQFLHEARTVAKLSHPYIVPIHECLESDGDLYLVFEYVEGETLDRRLVREARLPLKECRRILSHVGAAVDHAHKNHVLHRDLKPANIMLDTGGIARVMDFGIALESTRTMTNWSPAVLDDSGTLRYMPPEQHFGKSVRASDIYAMGVCLYEMSTGHPPFAARGVEELIEAKRARRYPAPSSIRSELPKEFDLFIAAALEPDPQNRVSSAPEFLELLDAIPV
jgi:tRNA A-37 threonylcarbamoyl transferase component Bud32